MSERPYGQRGQIELAPHRTDANGRPLCRWCGQPVPKGRRRSWCSAKCVDEWRERGHWDHIRNRIIERDKVCQMCGGERPVRDAFWSERTNHPALFNRWRIEAWGPYSVVKYGHWEVDHIVAVQDGGTDDPQNLRLLCRPCHKDVTARQRREKAERRRGQLSLGMPEVSESHD